MGKKPNAPSFLKKKNVTSFKKSELQPFIPSGFINAGNTCYLNSLFQAFPILPPFWSYTPEEQVISLQFSDHLYRTWTWLKCNDKSVMPIKPDALNNHDSYVLFYIQSCSLSLLLFALNICGVCRAGPSWFCAHAHMHSYVNITF